MIDELLKVFKKTLDKWGRQTGFIRRKKIISAIDFLALMTVGQLGIKHPSLAGMVEAIKVKISREGMHRRFTGTAVAFMRRCSEFVLRPKASEIMAGTNPDNSYTCHLSSHLQPGDLILFDLGYFCTKTLSNINRIGAYFLCRFLVGTALLNPVTLMPVDLLQTLKKMKGNFDQMKVLMGSKKRGIQVICRLVCLRGPQEIANERRRKMRISAQRKKGRGPRDYHLQMADWILMVTNVPEEWLSPEMMRPFYSLRWQIEILFKQIKTVMCIHKSHTSKENRLLCEIYGKLIMAVMIHRIHADINIRLWNTKRRELSMEKLYKRIQSRAFIILDLLLVSLQKAIEYLQEEIPRLIKNCMKLHQRSRRSTLEIIEYGPCQLGKMQMIKAA